MPQKVKLALFYLGAGVLVLTLLFGLFFGFFYLFAWISSSLQTSDPGLSRVFAPTNALVLSGIFLASLGIAYLLYISVIRLVNHFWDLESHLGPLFRSPRRGAGSRSAAGARDRARDHTRNRSQDRSQDRSRDGSKDREPKAGR